MAELLWQPVDIEQTPVEKFRLFVNERHGLSLQSFADLHAWSVAEMDSFWVDLWDFSEVRAQTRGERVRLNPDAMPGVSWFPDARLNYADNLLRRNDDSIAIVFRSENGEERTLTHAQLVAQVASVSRKLRSLGVVSGDRVAGFLPNMPEAIVAALATASVGAVWSSCSPDFGINGVLDRFGQIEPKVLFTADGYHYNGKQHDSLGLVSELVESMPSIEQVVVVDYINAGSLSGAAAKRGSAFSDWANDGLDLPLQTEPLPFNHPLFIMFSSGTTGKPKCIVHGAGGTLLQHIKEHQFHVGLKPNEKLFFFTTCGWMMWNWLISGLATEATLVLYDGSPFYPDGNVVFDYADSVGMHYLGTSAKFIDACNKAGIVPAKTHKLAELKSVLSTGSPLVPESFDYVYSSIKNDVCLSSMSGGTDIISCFALGNPALPVYRGELQCLGLGMDVQAYDEAGNALPAGEKGELVCAQPFPCMPIGFFDDDDGSRYHSAYFDRYDNTWCHGDYVSVTDNAGMVIYGRSDAVLNPGGVRIGTAEIYRQVEKFDEVIESIVIGQQWQNDVRVVLFVRLRDGLSLDEDLSKRLQTYIREQTTPRHMPARVLQVADIPRTRSGKIVELAVRKIVHGENVENVEALANPDALNYFVNRPELQS